MIASFQPREEPSGEMDEKMIIQLSSTDAMGPSTGYSDTEPGRNDDPNRISRGIKDYRQFVKREFSSVLPFNLISGVVELDLTSHSAFGTDRPSVCLAPFRLVG